jgi:thiol-disulfide isomerase/thioredoxin
MFEHIFTCYYKLRKLFEEEIEMKKILVIGVATALLLTGCGGASAGENVESEATQEASVDQNLIAGTELKGFEAKTLTGQTATEDIFTGSKITVLNLWGTFCGPCVEEMPDLEFLSKEYDASDVQVVGVVSDSENSEEAKKIVEKLGVTYKNLLADDKLKEQYVNKFDYVPVTVFVDSEGKVLETFVPGSASKEEFKKIIDGLLK